MTQKTSLSAVLVVEDDEDARNVYQDCLARIGYDVTEAADGRAAMQLLQASQYDIVILDLDIPVINGVSILRILRNTPAYQNTTILVISAETQMVTGEVDAKADYVMQKPVNLKELEQFLERIKNA